MKSSSGRSKFSRRSLKLPTIHTALRAEIKCEYEVVVAAEEVTVTVDGSAPAAATPVNRDRKRHEHVACYEQACAS